MQLLEQSINYCDGKKLNDIEKCLIMPFAIRKCPMEAVNLLKYLKFQLKVCFSGHNLRKWKENFLICDDQATSSFCSER